MAENNTQKHVQAEKEPRTATVVKTAWLNVRKQPDKESKVVGLAQKGDQLLVDSVSKGWAYVKTPKDVVGYVSTEFIKEG